MVEELDHGWFKSEDLLFKDDRRLTNGRTTYTVRKKNYEELGRLIWTPCSRTYLFHDKESLVFNKKYLQQIAEFLELLKALRRRKAALKAWKTKRSKPGRLRMVYREKERQKRELQESSQQKT